MWLFLVLVLADATPSQSEYFGYYIFFGLMILLFLIAWLFSPKQKTLSEILVRQPGEGGGSAKTNLIVLAIIAGIILYFAYALSNH